jgi:hypothetical protein
MPFLLFMPEQASYHIDLKGVSMFQQTRMERPSIRQGGKSKIGSSFGQKMANTRARTHKLSLAGVV